MTRAARCVVLVLDQAKRFITRLRTFSTERLAEEVTLTTWISNVPSWLVAQPDGAVVLGEMAEVTPWGMATAAPTRAAAKAKLFIAKVFEVLVLWEEYVQ